MLPALVVRDGWWLTRAWCFVWRGRASDGRVTNRTMGHSKRGRVAKTNRYFFHRGRRFSCLGPFALDEGFLSECIIEGGFTKETFLMALVQTVVTSKLELCPNTYRDHTLVRVSRDSFPS